MQLYLIKITIKYIKMQLIFIQITKICINIRKVLDFFEFYAYNMYKYS